LTDATEQVEKQIIVMRLAVSIYNMGDHQLPALLEALERPVAQAVEEPSASPQVDYSAYKNDMMRRQMMIARIFVLIQKLDFKALLARLRSLNDPEMQWVRKYPRIACYLDVDFATKGKAYRSCIRDISANGIFIETAEKFAPGQMVDMCFSIHEVNESLAFKIKGRVMRISTDGIGIQYQQMTDYRREILTTLINKLC
jgi:hypothetical protein